MDDLRLRLLRRARTAGERDQREQCQVQAWLPAPDHVGCTSELRTAGLSRMMEQIRVFAAGI